MRVLISGTIALQSLKRDEALSGAREYILDARTEPGCLAYNWSPDLNDDCTICVFGEWESQYLLDQHFNAHSHNSYRNMMSYLEHYQMTHVTIAKYLVQNKAPVYNDKQQPTAYF
jgi:quinol monooxygenase YgiN